jgi:hypothetical protein
LQSSFGSAGSKKDSSICCSWVARYIRFHRLRHPCELGPEQVRRFLEDRKNSAEERAEAQRALAFLYDEFLPSEAALCVCRWVQCKLFFGVGPWAERPSAPVPRLFFIVQEFFHEYVFQR